MHSQKRPLLRATNNYSINHRKEAEIFPPGESQFLQKTEYNISPNQSRRADNDETSYSSIYACNPKNNTEFPYFKPESKHKHTHTQKYI